VPSTHRTAEGFRSGQWVVQQRYKKDSLSAIQRERLEALDGWVWDTNASAWEEGFGHLIAFVEAEGHARVPRPHRTETGYGLASWVNSQRTRRDSLSVDRRERLEALDGWVWDARAAAWEEGYAHLTAYVQAEGHARVLMTHRAPDGYKLGSWVNSQRTRRDSLSVNHRERLEALDGWVWNASVAAWEEGFDHLTAYVHAENHTHVPSTHRTADGYRLGQWVGVQRTTKERLSVDRRERLEAVDGWVWDTNAVAWEKGFHHLIAYVQAEGHARVQSTHRTAEGFRVGQWVREQRRNQDRLSPDRRERLEGLDGWVWDPFTADWERGFLQLTAYVEAEGSARVPTPHRGPDGYRLGQWVGVQRTKRDSLSVNHRERLEALDGWVWNAKDADWEEGFAQLTIYAQAEGHARVGTTHRTADGYPLGQWVRVQRRNKGRMRTDRRERLEAVDGWVWDAAHPQ
jgi:hypothetical protein